VAEFKGSLIVGDAHAMKQPAKIRQPQERLLAY